MPPHLTPIPSHLAPFSRAPTHLCHMHIHLLHTHAARCILDRASDVSVTRIKELHAERAGSEVSDLLPQPRADGGGAAQPVQQQARLHHAAVLLLHQLLQAAWAGWGDGVPANGLHHVGGGVPANGLHHVLRDGLSPTPGLPQKRATVLRHCKMRAAGQMGPAHHTPTTRTSHTSQGTTQCGAACCSMCSAMDPAAGQ